MKRFWLAFLVCVLSSSIVASNIDNEKIAKEYDIQSVINLFKGYIEESNIDEIDVNSLFNSLINADEIVSSSKIKTGLNLIFTQIKGTFKEITSIFILVLLCAILTNIQLNENSEVVKITKLVIYIAIASILVKNYLDIIVVFRQVINKLTVIMQTVSTFLIGVVVATGKITSSTVIKSVILCVSNVIYSIIEYVVIPFFNISLVINIVSRVSENIKLSKLSSIFRKSSLYIFMAIVGIFLSVLKLETTITSSMDGLTYKTAQDVISNTVPVVGGFLSDSLDTVISSTKFIGKAGGVFAIICTGIIVLNPVIKILSIVIMYSLLVAISEPINEDKNIKEFLEEFTKIYKDMLGIIIGVMAVFVISTAIIMATIGSIGG